MRILLVEGDAPLADSLFQRLVQEEFAVQLVSNRKEAERRVADESYDLVILDLNLAGNAGLDVLRQIRLRKPQLPVLIVNGSPAVEERIRGLDAGADDWIAKPLVFAELAARIRAVLRRTTQAGNTVLTVSDLALDRLNRTAQRGGNSIDLSPKEFALLEFLMKHAGSPVARAAIVEQVWKLKFDSMTNVVDVYINYLRRKVDAGYGHALIRTVRGVGYQIGANASSA